MKRKFRVPHDFANAEICRCVYCDKNKTCKRLQEFIGYAMDGVCEVYITQCINFERRKDAPNNVS